MAQAHDQIDDEFIGKELEERLNMNEMTNKREQHHNKTTPNDSNNTAQGSQDGTLIQLPPELILLIFSYIDARFTLTVLCQVCKLFNQLLSSEASWKTRFGKRWPSRDRKEDYDYVVR